MRVLVAGAGAIGQWLGARLQAAGHDVTLLCRPRHADAVRRRLVVHGHTAFDGPMQCITTVAAADGAFDAIFVTTKAYGTAQVASDVAPLLAEGGVLASIQNGLGNGEKLLRVVAPEAAAVCLTSHGVTLEAPGRVHHAGTGATQVGPVPGHPQDRGARIAAALLADAGLEPTWHDEMRPRVWMKAIVNAAINPVGALHGVRNGAILERGELHELSLALAGEAAALARRAGVELPGDPVATVDTVLAGTAGNKCSMLQDVQAGRATEIEQITGRMLRVAGRLGVSMPRSESIYGRIKQLERSCAAPGEAERSAQEEARSIDDPV